MENVTVQVQSVLYHNEPKAIERAIESIARAVEVTRRESTLLGQVGLCYGDASSSPVFTPEQMEKLAARYKNVLTLNNLSFGENTGTAKGHNRLADNCSSDYIMIMNPDVIVNPHIFEQLLAPFADPTKKTGITEARQTPIEHGKWYDPETGETSWVSTACAIFPTVVFREIGGFDAETFFMYCDDLDFSWRVRLAGYRAVYVPGAPVFHAKRLSGEGTWIPTNAEMFYSAEAALLLPYKWSNPRLTQEIMKDYLRMPSNRPEHRAAKSFLDREKRGTLPKPIDPEHAVASFTGQGYGKYRFLFDIA